MKYWEYCQIHTYGKFWTCEPEGAALEIGDVTGLSSLEIANRLGRKGWEMVTAAVESTVIGMRTQMFFKRRRVPTK